MATTLKHSDECICDRCCDEAPDLFEPKAEPTVAPTDAEVRAFVLSVLGDRKAAVEDITPALNAWAADWLGRYEGDFDYLLDLQRRYKRFGSLFDSQAKGILNCYRARVIREERGDARRSSPDGPHLVVPDPPEGIHYVDGTVYKVQRAVTTTGRPYAKRLVADGANPTWLYEGRTPFAKLSADTLMTRENAEEYGRLYGVCAICGRLLTDEVSIARGIGPVCLRKQGW